VQSTVKLGDGRRAREETNPEEKAAVSRERPKAYVWAGFLEEPLALVEVDALGLASILGWSERGTRDDGEGESRSTRANGEEGKPSLRRGSLPCWG
jgi:hypothetical protein